jgi:sugar lactone lactonase YvrE
MFGIDPAPAGHLLVADAGQGVVDADTGALLAPLPGVTDLAPIGRGDMYALTSTFAPDAHGALYRVSQGSVRKLADLQDYEVQNDPAGDGTDEGSDPFDLALINGGSTLIADAAGNDLLVSDAKGRVDWVASFPEQNGIQAVPTSVAIGPDGAYYVGELTGFPAPLGASRVWRIAPGTRHAHCGASPDCSVVLSGLTSIDDLAFGPDGKLYVAQLDDAGWPALEQGTGVGGSVHACSVATGNCQTVTSGVPILTSIAFRGSTLWGTILALVPGQADVVPLN